ncbi:MAG: dihydropteroate synthase [Thermodesulfobacteriota bacterium]|nr:dihydropteroate synthase [Thermodesulfobacteriota bacterium]
MKYLSIRSPFEAEEKLKRVGVDPHGIKAMIHKMENLNILLEGIECKVANILKQEMLSLGGDVAVARGSVECSIEKTDAIIIGTVKQVEALAGKISIQPFGLKLISVELKNLLVNLSRDSFVVRTPRREILMGRKTLLMGVINVTPDSFSDGGMFMNPEEAVEYGIKMEEDGADILDIGGESSRPGSEHVSAEEEMKRVIPVIESLGKHVTIPISIDTTKSEIARMALEVGAEMVNDISAMRFDEEMAGVAAHYKVPVVLMHMRGAPKTMQEGDLSYPSLRGDIMGFLEERIDEATSAGIERDNIIIDPGIGFGKTAEDNIRLIKYLKEFKGLGRPILIGTSRKGFIGKTTGGGTEERLEGTTATVTAAILNGAHVVRVHDVGFMKKVSIMADAIKNA